MEQFTSVKTNSFSSRAQYPLTDSYIGNYMAGHREIYIVLSKGLVLGICQGVFAGLFSDG